MARHPAAHKAPWWLSQAPLAHVVLGTSPGTPCACSNPGSTRFSATHGRHGVAWPRARVSVASRACCTTKQAVGWLAGAAAPACMRGSDCKPMAPPATAMAQACGPVVSLPPARCRPGGAAPPWPPRRRGWEAVLQLPCSVVPLVNQAWSTASRRPRWVALRASATDGHGPRTLRMRRA